MTEHDDEIVRIGNGQNYIRPVTYWVETKSKTDYETLTNIYKVRASHYLRKVLYAEYMFMFEHGEQLNADARALAETLRTSGQGRVKREGGRLVKQIPLFVDKKTLELIDSVKERFPEIPRGDRIRLAWAKEIQRLMIKVTSQNADIAS